MQVLQSTFVAAPSGIILPVLREQPLEGRGTLQAILVQMMEPAEQEQVLQSTGKEVPS